MNTRVWSTLCVLVVSGVLAGCSAGPAVVHVKGIAPMNLNEAGESTPVEVRIYALKDDQKFMSVPFDQLWTADATALGGDKLADPKVITVQPSATDDKPVDVEIGMLPTDARFVGVMALYPKGDDKGDRRIAVLVGEAGGKVFEFTGYRIQLKK